MAAISDLRSTIESVVLLASAENRSNSLGINARQCELLAKKASTTLQVLSEYQNVLRRLEVKQGRPDVSRDWNPAIKELHRVLKGAENLIRDCCCSGEWLKAAIKRGNLKETFAKLLYDIEWHTSVLCSAASALVAKSGNGDILEESACDGKLGITEHFFLLEAAEQDRESLRELLRVSHVCDKEICNPDLGEQSCQAVKLLEILDADEQEAVDKSDLRKSPLVLWVPPTKLTKVRGLGKGAFAEVKETKWLGQRYAHKIFRGGTAHDATFRQEIQAMAGLDHPNIVRIVCCAEDKHNLGIVMELMYKSLFDLLQDYKMGTHAPGETAPFSIIQSVDLMLQIAEGVKYLHSKRLAHRDLKSPNILVQFANPQIITDVDNTVHFTGTETPFIAKIADFGLTKMKNASTRMVNQTMNTGTRAWMAPEVFRFSDSEAIEASARFHPMKLDTYSFAMMCYEILTAEVPYAKFSVSGRKLFELVESGCRPELPMETPPRLAALIKRCWDGDPRLRPDFPAICTELRFVKGHLLRGNDLVLKETEIKSKSIFEMAPGIKVQGPWGGTGGGHFFDPVTSLKLIKLKYDTNVPCIWYIEMQFNIFGIPFVIGHGDINNGSKLAMIDFDESSEYVAQLEGWFGLVPIRLGSNKATGLTSITFHTNVNTYGPFGGVGQIPFKSDYGKIVGFYGRCGSLVDQIGCFIAPILD